LRALRNLGGRRETFAIRGRVEGAIVAKYHPAKETNDIGPFGRSAKVESSDVKKLRSLEEVLVECLGAALSRLSPHRSSWQDPHDECHTKYLTDAIH